MKNILITGGAGFIGSNLSLKLISKGYNSISNILVISTLSKLVPASIPPTLYGVRFKLE